MASSCCCCSPQSAKASRVPTWRPWISRHTPASQRAEKHQRHSLKHPRRVDVDDHVYRRNATDHHCEKLVERADVSPRLFSKAGFKRASRAAAGLLRDGLGIDRAFKILDACGYRAGCPFGHDARKRKSREHFVGIASFDSTL